MSHPTHELYFPGKLLQRGFWLYVWEITTPAGERLYYVGRTGDSSSPNAQSPFNRMGQHLGFNEKANVLRRQLTHENWKLDPEECSFRLVAHGPMLGEEKDFALHREPRNVVAALEKALAVAMKDAGYAVINTVRSHAPLDPVRFAAVRAAFAVHFPRLQSDPVAAEILP